MTILKLEVAPSLLDLAKEKNTSFSLGTTIPSVFGDVQLSAEKVPIGKGRFLEVRVEFPKIFELAVEPIYLPRITPERDLVALYTQRLALIQRAIKEKWSRLAGRFSGIKVIPGRLEQARYRDMLDLVLSASTFLRLSTRFYLAGGTAALSYETGPKRNSLIWQYPCSIKEELVARHEGTPGLGGARNEMEVALAYRAHRDLMESNLYEAGSLPLPEKRREARDGPRSRPTRVPFLRILCS